MLEKITVGGSEIPQSKDTKLLGMKVHESQKWTKHIEETILALNIKEAINMSTAKRLIKAYSRKMPI